MIDPATNKPIRVSTDAVAGSSIEVPLSLLEGVRKLLTEHEVSHWADNLAISFNGQPAQVMIYIGRKVDPARVQTLLDESA